MTLLFHHKINYKLWWFAECRSALLLSKMWSENTSQWLHSAKPDFRNIQPVIHMAWPWHQVQQSCKPHYPSSVIHTHYYFTSSGTTALTAPVSSTLIREKALSQLTVVYLYNLQSSAARWFTHTTSHISNMLTCSSSDPCF